MQSIVTGAFAALYFFILWRKIDKKELEILNYRSDILSYAIELSNLPENFNLGDFLNESWKQDTEGENPNNLYSVSKIIECRDIREMHNLSIQHADGKKQQIIDMHKYGMSGEQQTGVIRRISDTEKKLNGVYQEILACRDYQTDNAILIFTRPEARDRFFYKSKKSWTWWIFNTHYREYKNQRIYMDLAASPKEIKWQNYGYNAKTRRIRLSITWISTLALLVLSFWINKLLTNVMDREGDMLSVKGAIIGLIASLFIVLNNFILSNVIYYFTYYIEKHLSTTNAELSYSLKLTIVF